MIHKVLHSGTPINALVRLIILIGTPVNFLVNPNMPCCTDSFVLFGGNSLMTLITSIEYYIYTSLLVHCLISSTVKTGQSVDGG